MSDKSKKLNTIRIGTRGSKLALWQAGWVADQLKKHWPDLVVDLVPIKTTGDKKNRQPLSKIGGKALFTKEIEEALLAVKIDLAVHSLKDLPFHLPSGVRLASVPTREDPRDVLVSHNNTPFDRLPPNTKVGTSSLRRKCQLKSKRPDLVYADIRGNVDTRIQKVKKGEFDAVVLAAAGVKRLGLEGSITEYLDLIPAVGQGALGIEIRQSDEVVASLLNPLNDEPSYRCIAAERAFLKIMGGTCNIPLGCHAKLAGSEMELRAFLSDLVGKKMIYRSKKIKAEEGVKAAERLAHEILDAGGRGILDELMTTGRGV